MLVIEHNLDVIKTADYIIDLGPEGGDKGGTIFATGTPEEIADGRKLHRSLFKTNFRSVTANEWTKVIAASRNEINS